MIKKPMIQLFIALLFLTLGVGCSEDISSTDNSDPTYEFTETVTKIGKLGSTDVYVTDVTGVIFPEPRRFRSKEQEDLDNKIAQYEMIIDLFPDLNFYAFYLELIQYSEHNPMNKEYPDVDAGKALEYFVANKPAELKLEILPLTSFKDQIDYYYRTDHHWNVLGVMTGYERIYKMLAKNYRDISSMNKPTRIHTFEDIEFVGTWARELGYEAAPEPFKVGVYDLPPYKVYDSSGNELDYGRKEEYFNGEYGEDFYTDHYVDYYGVDDVGYLEYISQNGAERNLLIIGDSFTNAIEPLLASHYNHTYCIDIRRLPDYDFSMSEFTAEHEVDDVLFLGGAEVIFYTWRWTIKP